MVCYEQWFSLLPLDIYCDIQSGMNLQAQCIKIKVPEKPTVYTDRVQGIHQTHKNDSSLLKTTSSLLCTKNEMFRVKITEINKEKKFTFKFPLITLPPPSSLPASMQTQQSLLRLWRWFHTGWKAHTISCYSGEARNMSVSRQCRHWDGECTQAAWASLDWLPLQTAHHSL